MTKIKKRKTRNGDAENPNEYGLKPRVAYMSTNPLWCRRQSHVEYMHIGCLHDVNH